MPLPYVFVEYPKWVTPSGGEPCVVQNAEQEAAIMASAHLPTSRDVLAAEATALGIKVDGRWSIDRLKTAISSASESNPAKQDTTP